MSHETQTERKLRHELPEDIEFKSSPNLMRQFMAHVGWMDMRAYLEDHILWCHEKMEGVHTLEELKYYQGQIAAAKSVLGFPNYVIEQLEAE